MHQRGWAVASADGLSSGSDGAAPTSRTKPRAAACSCSVGSGAGSCCMPCSSSEFSSMSSPDWQSALSITASGKENGGYGRRTDGNQDGIVGPAGSVHTSQQEARQSDGAAWWRFAVKVYTTGPCIVKRPPIDGEGAASHGSKANSLRPSHSCAHGCRCACHSLRLRMLAL